MKKLILKSPEFAMGEIELTPEQLPVVLGRSKNAGIQIKDDLLSREHAKIRLNSVGQFEIVDCDSMNLTIVNKHDVTSHVLQDGDEILLGETEILVHVHLPVSDLNDQTTRDLTIVPGKDDETIGN